MRYFDSPFILTIQNNARMAAQRCLRPRDQGYLNVGSVPQTAAPTIGRLLRGSAGRPNQSVGIGGNVSDWF